VSSCTFLTKKPLSPGSAMRTPHAERGSRVFRRPERLPWFIHASLRIGPVDDPLEREADHSADRVTQTALPPSLQRTCACEGSGEPCTQCALQRLTIVQRISAPAKESNGVAPQMAIDAVTRPGRPIEPSVRETLEPRFGASFENVRVHDDAEAAAAAESVNARAYTIGNHVVFGAGEYQPQTTQGQHILAHELTHTLQQQPTIASLEDPSLQTLLRQELPNPAASPPSGTGLRNPDITENTVVAAAEGRRITVLETALQTLQAFQPTLGAALPGNLAFAAHSALNMFPPTFDPSTAVGTRNIGLLQTATSLLQKNHDLVLPPFAVDESSKCTPTARGTQLADAGLFDNRDPRRPMLICPGLFGTRPECQAFVIMHEVFHLVGVIGHGTDPQHNYTPEFAVANPSSLATFAWILATGTDPNCDEGSSLAPLPTSPQGPVA
jgi:Domain of unknown function (DUF4157)